MFYESVKAAYEAERLKIGLPEDGYGKHGAVLATGIDGLKAKFLSRSELNKLVDLARRDTQNTIAYWKTSNMVRDFTLAARTFAYPIADKIDFYNGYLKALEDNSILTATQLSSLRDHLKAEGSSNAN